MSRYDFLKRRIEAGDGVYLPYVLMGYPTMDASLEVCRALVAEGVHGFELGFPFSDPVADGPVIQNAADEALKSGFKVAKAVDLVQKIRALNTEIPLTAMSYYNMVLTYGPEKFLSEFSAAGLDGLLIPDLPPERAEEIVPLAQKYNIETVFIAAPNSDADRLKRIAEHVGGFVYVVTRLGITGTDPRHSDALAGLFARLREHIALPAIAGFGISKPEHATATVKAGADGVIAGSRIVELTREGWNGKTLDSSALRTHTQEMVSALRGIRGAKTC